MHREIVVAVPKTTSLSGKEVSNLSFTPRL